MAQPFRRMVFLPPVLFPDNHVDKKRRAVRKVGPPLGSFQLFAFAAGAFAGSAAAAAARTTFSRARAAAGGSVIQPAASAIATLARAGTATALRAALSRDSVGGLIERCGHRG